ncbi:unnamed protein product [Musa hybrid cultivar]
MHLRNVSALRVLDLSGDALRASIPNGFWFVPALLQVNLADNALAPPSGWTPRDPNAVDLSLSVSTPKSMMNFFTQTPSFAASDVAISLHFVSKASVAHSSSLAPSVVRSKKYELIFS